MTFERISNKKNVASNLNNFIGSSLIMLQNQKIQKNAEYEAKFLNSVLEDNLSFDDQIKFREEQIKNVDKGDTKERMRLRNQVANLKDQREVQNFNNAYLEELISFNSGIQSIDGTISWLQDRLTKVTDIKIKNTIKNQLSNLKTRQYAERKNVLERQTQYANEDKTEAVLGKQIANLSSERKTALAIGNDDYVSILDMQLQSLHKSSAQAKINKIATEMSVSTATGQSSLDLLNKFNTMFETAGVDTPINIGGVNFANEKEFWNAKRGEYLNDRTGNGFFGRYASELKDKVDYKQSKNVLKNTDMTSVNNWYDTIKDRPELLGYEDKINQEQQKGVNYTANLRATEITNKFATDLDVNNAIDNISYLQDNFGVNLNTSYQRIIQSAASEKSGQMQQILGTMRQIMHDFPGTSQNDALKRAVQSGAGAVSSPIELATGKASDIITGLGDKAKEQEFGEDDAGITIKEPISPATDLSEGSFYKTPDSPAVFKFEGGKLRPFEGNWTSETFQQATGKTFGDVEKISDISNVEKGDPFRTTDFKVTTEASKLISQEQTTTPTTEPIIESKSPNIIDYKIQQGDTLSQIASQNKTTVDDILKANKEITNPNKISAGAILKLPKQ